MNNAEFDRVIRFEGAENVRDLGGIPTRSGATTRFGVIYRGDGLARLTDADLERIGDLGIRSIIDLRSEEERHKAPDRLPARATPEVFCRGFVPLGSVAMMDGVNNQGADADAAFELMRVNYSRIPFEHTAEFRDILRFIISHGRAPHYVHCSLGKDRTGIVVALILRALGVSVDDVVADFEMTKGEFPAVDIFGPDAREDAIAVIMAAPPGYILATLEAIDQRYGDIDSYLNTALGFGAEEREMLQAMLVD